MNPYPLQWPVGRKRMIPGNSPFERHSVDKARIAVVKELRRYGVSDDEICISSNLQLRLDGWPKSNQIEPADAGVAVYFRKGGKDHVMACDKWSRVACNLWAIARHLDALRGQERWGVESSEQALSHFLALPERGSGPSWWTVLGVPYESTVETVRQAYRTAAKACHPNGDTPDATRWQLVSEAFLQATAFFEGKGIKL